MTFEQTTSLFALAIADVLMINLWTTDVGRYNASNYGLLKVIFEVNLKLFAHSQNHKKLIFVLRDFNELSHNKKKIIELLENNVRSIWGEIYKTEQFQDSSPHDFFDFEFVTMPHKLYQPKEFVDSGMALRERFQVDNPDSLFPIVESANVPIDGLPMFIDNCWTCIREQKELNLPGEKQMVATYRCQEIKQEAINCVQERLDDLQQRSFEGIVDDYKIQCTDILRESYYHYDEYAKQYYNETYKSVKLELTNHIVDLLYKSFVSQLKNLSLQGDKKFAKALKNTFSEDSVTDTFTETCQGLFDDTIMQFEKNSNMLTMDDAEDWQKAIDLYKKELSNSLVKMIETERTKQKEKLFTFSVETIVDELEDKITQPIKDLEDNLWENVNEKYKEIILEEEEKIKAILNDGFKTQDEEYDSFLTKLEDKVYNQSKRLIIRTVSDLNSHLNRKFNYYFKKDSEGKHRDWKNLTEDEIEKLHKS